MLDPATIARVVPREPCDLPGCVLGLQGNRTKTAIGAAVGPWIDCKGLGNAVQATGSKQGLAARGAGELAVQMDGSDDMYAVADRDSLDFGTNDFTVGVRWYSDGSVRGNCNLFNKFAANSYNQRGYILAYGALDNKLAGYVDASSALFSSTDAQVSAGWRTALLYRSGATVTLYVNGASQGSAGSQGAKVATSGANLVMQGQGTSWYGADIAYAGLWVWNRALTAAEIAAVTAWRSR